MGGRGCYATASIPAGSLVCCQGGRVYPIDEEIGDYGIQIADNWVLGPLHTETHDADFMNHSCDPNLGFHGQVFLVTLRDVSPGEELCFDYATCLGGSIPFEMVCHCGTPDCRGIITKDDWKKPELQSRYAGRFQWYLERQIRHAGGPVELCDFPPTVPDRITQAGVIGL